MRIRRAMRKKPLRRPIKSPGARRYRLAQHKKRLIELGVSEEALRTMNIPTMRKLLQRPNQIKAD